MYLFYFVYLFFHPLSIYLSIIHPYISSIHSFILLSVYFCIRVF